MGVGNLAQSLDYRPVSSPILRRKESLDNNPGHGFVGVERGIWLGQPLFLYHKGLLDSDRRVCSVLENKNAWVGNYAQANQAKEQWLYLPVVADILGPGNSGRAGK